MSESKHIVTLSDHNYLTYGLTLYDSLEQYDDYQNSFVLHYLCTSQEAYDKLCSLQLPNIKPEVKTIGSPKPNIKTQIIVAKKNNKIGKSSV